MIGQELMADIMEIADQRDVTLHFCETVADMRHRGRRLIAVDGDPYEFGAGADKRRDLSRRPFDIGRIRVGHRLNRDWRAAAGEDHGVAGTNAHANRAAAGCGPGALGVREAGGGGMFRAIHARYPWLRGRPAGISHKTVAIITRSAAESGAKTLFPSSLSSRAAPGRFQRAPAFDQSQTFNGSGLIPIGAPELAKKKTWVAHR